MNVERFLIQVKQNLPEHEGVTTWIENSALNVGYGKSESFEIRYPGGIGFIVPKAMYKTMDSQSQFYTYTSIGVKYTDEELAEIFLLKMAGIIENEGYIAKEAVSNNDLISVIKTGKYAIFGGRRSDVKTTNLYGFDCVEAEPTYGIIGTNNIINSLACVSATSKHPEKAVQVLNLIWSDPELLNLLAYLYLQSVRQPQKQKT